jgi:hypothetical protein
MADINSIIEMVEKRRAEASGFDAMSAGERIACDDIIEQLRKMEDKEPELRRCLKSLVEVTKHLNLCPSVMSECEDVLK